MTDSHKLSMEEGIRNLKSLCFPEYKTNVVASRSRMHAIADSAGVELGALIEAFCANHPELAEKFVEAGWNNNDAAEHSVVE